MSKNPWIDTNEMVPNDGEDVLVCETYQGLSKWSKIGIGRIYTYMDGKGKEYKKWTFNEKEMPEHVIATYWAPLPELPNKDKGDDIL